MRIEKDDFSIVDSVMQSIIKYNVELASDFAEVGLDDLLEDSMLREIPIVKYFVSIARTGFAIREKHMLEKTLIFINKLNSNGLSNKDYEEYIERLKKNEKTIKKEVERVIIILDRMFDERKSIILANLYFSYICKKINWSHFQELAFIVDYLFDEDIKELLNIEKKGKLLSKEITNPSSINRLSNHYLIDNTTPIIGSKDTGQVITLNKKDYVITTLGQDFIKYGLNDYNIEI